ncbi:MAG: saccharopine dehydrogenase NADP-binding domain-containing protein, partial [Methanoregula sp.]
MGLEFKNKVLIIGYGAVSKCTLPILLRHVTIPLENITIIDFKNKSPDLKAWTPRGLQFVKCKVTPENLTRILGEYLPEGSLLIDLAWNIDCCEIVQWCHDHNVMYVNTSVEAWDPDADTFTASPYEKTLYYRQMKLHELTKDLDNAATCVVDHGANPGLISHFARQGLCDIAQRMIADGIAPDPVHIEQLIKEQKFGELAMATGVKVIHCSERDTQITRSPKKVDEFVGTWCIE